MWLYSFLLCSMTDETLLSYMLPVTFQKKIRQVYKTSSTPAALAVDALFWTPSAESSLKLKSPQLFCSTIMPCFVALP